ncbi:MAG: hypothetical protein NTZ49_05650 [Candidatus Parcubacteria bacterium]|nr:hypothetical protein [Candidatus Parcubacteria bacterium]
MKKLYCLLLVCLILIISGCAIKNQTPNISNEPQACTQEAKLCPDGSYVGRTGPNCEFAECGTDFTQCNTNSDCENAFELKRSACHNNICTSPIARECTGENDNTCPDGYRCAQYCFGEGPFPFYCQLNEIVTQTTCN